MSNVQADKDLVEKPVETSCDDMEHASDNADNFTNMFFLIRALTSIQADTRHSAWNKHSWCPDMLVFALFQIVVKVSPTIEPALFSSTNSLLTSFHMQHQGA